MTETARTVTYAEAEFEPGVHLWLGNEKTPWRVLEVDRKTETALLITEKPVCERPYHSKWTEITWEQCDLRKWLNEEYYEKIFSEEEKAAILECELKNPDNSDYGTKGGKDTRDRVFLLSIGEAEKYFTDYRDRSTGTWWWLRSPGGFSKVAASVVDFGGIRSFGYDVNLGYGVRPALKINLKSELFQSFISYQSSESIIIKVPELFLENGEVIYAFPDVKIVTIPEGVTSIGKSAFSGCAGLTSITIPEGITSIGKSAFINCKKLSRIVTGSKLPANCFDKNFSGTVLTNDPANLPVKMKPLAAISFAENPDDPTSERGKKHLKYIKSNAAKLKDMAFSNPALLRLMCRNKLLTPEITDQYLDTARATGSAEVTAMLLDYKQNILTENEKAKAAQKAEKREETVTDFVFSAEALEQLHGKMFVVTGKLNSFSSREEFKACLDACGAILSETLNEQTDYLITNTPDSGSAKNKKADALGVIKLSEEEFNRMIGRRKGA